MKLSPNELAWLTLKKWPDKTKARVMVAIAIAESAGDTNAMHRSTTGTNVGNWDHGLWQGSNKYNGAKLQKHPNWRDPLEALEIAWEIYNEFLKAGKDPYSAWHVYTSGSHTQYLPDADIALEHPFPPPQA